MKVRRRAAGTGAPALYCCLGCRLAAAVAGSEDGQRRFLEARLLFCAFLAMGVMTFSLVLYGDAVFDAADARGAAFIRQLGRWSVAALSLPVLLLLGLPMARGAWLDLRAGLVRMDGLIVLATFAAWGLSLHATISADGEVYFETATMVLVLVNFGRRLEAHARTHGRDAAALYAECLPERATRVREGILEEVGVDTLRAGDEVRVTPGSTFPADCRLLAGESTVVAAHLTGEESPRSARAGDVVPAGSVNGPGLMTARVVSPAREGSLARVVRLLEAPPLAPEALRTIDRLAGVLVAVSVTLAAVSGWRAAAGDGPGAGIRTALSVLLVACPCALGLAIPLAWRAMRAALARRGLLVHHPRALETAHAVSHVLLDKTGTLTRPGPLRMDTGRDLAPRMQSLLRDSGHALGRGIRSRAEGARSLEIRPGAGLVATVEGISCRLGSPEWMDREGCAWTPETRAARERLAECGETLVAYAENDRVQALGSVRHELRPGAMEAVARLRSLGLELELLSGDRDPAVQRVARELGIAARSGLSPAAKLERIHALQREGTRVMMVGDGVNDAPALRAADVGVAIADGTQTARAEADAELPGGALAGLPMLYEGARALRRCVRGNLTWTLLYNTVALGAAAAGWLHPLLAVSAMIASSLAVSVRSWRLLEFGAAR